MTKTIMTKSLLFAGCALVLCAGISSPAAAQSRQSCYPDCDLTHYYGPYDYRYQRAGTYCYPVCGPDGFCSPNPVCYGGATRGRVTVRSLAGTVTTTPTTATYDDPTITEYSVPPRSRRRR